VGAPEQCHNDEVANQTIAGAAHRKA
jgi:hypothetical protein